MKIEIRLGEIVLSTSAQHIPNLVFNFLKYYRRPITPLIRLSVCPSVTKSTGGVK